jgi:hypothetical protein
MVKVIPQAFIDQTFTELGAWLETDDSGTYFAGAGDGAVWNSGATFSTVRDAATGSLARGAWNSFDDTYIACYLNAGTFSIRRVFYPVDTSAIGAGATVTLGTFKIYSLAVNTGSFTHVLIQTSQASTASLSTADYDALTLNSPAEGCTRFANSYLAAAGYYDIALNATGLGWINVTGYSYLGFRQATNDVDNSEPASEVNYAYVSTSFQTGTDKDPKLYVEWTPPPGGGGMCGIDDRFRFRPSQSVN